MKDLFYVVLLKKTKDYLDKVEENCEKPMTNAMGFSQTNFTNTI